MKKLGIVAMVIFVAVATLGLSPAKASKTVKASEDEDGFAAWEDDNWSEEDPFSLETIDIPANFDDIKDNASKILGEVQKNTSKELSVFHRYKSEIDVIDDKLDLYDDALEVQYTEGKIKADEYQKLEKSIDAIDKILDQAEDLLEKQFGFAD